MAEYTRISFTERQLIFQLKNSGQGVRSIARILARSSSTISTELRRVKCSSHFYSALHAQKHAIRQRFRRYHKHKIHGPLEASVQFLLLQKRYSPVQISKYLKKKYPTLSILHISPEAIYKYVYGSPMRALFTKALRRKRKKRRQKKNFYSRGGIRNKTSIHKRPSEVQSREIAGHWEGDLIIGKGQKSAIGTLVERSTRYCLLIPLSSKDSETVTNAFVKAFETIPISLKKSLTYDQGREMAFHEKFTEKTNMNVYFADPGSPWQRGTNENTNGLVRDFLPKGTDFTNVTPEEINKIQHILNERPKSVLNYAMPKDALNWFSENSTYRLDDFLKENKNH